MLSKKSSLSLIFVATIAICFVSTSAVGDTPVPSNSDDYDYGVTFDAGSSGTRVYVYRWSHRVGSTQNEPYSYPLTQAAWSKKVSVRLADMASQPNNVGPLILQPLLLFVQQQLAGLEGRFSQFPVYLGATAGMRVLSSADRDTVMNAVRSFLNDKSKSPFAFKSENAKILSGEEEAVFGWIAANYVMKALSSSTGTTYGAMDLGGASTQMTFYPDQDPLSEQFALRLPDSSRSLYAVSYLRYGVNAATARLNQAVADSATGASVAHPCLPIGQTVQQNNSQGMTISLVGSSDFTGCSTYATQLLSLSAPCWYDNCAVTGVYQPRLPSQMTFLAFSTFAKIAGSLSLATNASLREMYNAATQVCALNATALAQTYPNDPDYRGTYCTTSSYVSVLLDKGYKFPLDNSKLMWAGVVTLPSGASYELEWTLGATLYWSNLLPYQRVSDPTPNPFKDSGVMATVIALAAALLFALIAVVVLATRLKGQSHMHFQTNI